MAIVGGGLGGICAGLYLEKVRRPSTRLHYREGDGVWAAWFNIVKAWSGRLCAACASHIQAGIGPFVIFEKSDEPGGVWSGTSDGSSRNAGTFEALSVICEWRGLKTVSHYAVLAANTYPGCACDIPAHLYSFAIEPEMDWSVRYPPQHGW